MQKKKNNIIFIVIISISLLGIFFVMKNSKTNTIDVTTSQNILTVYKSPTCGCCKNYISYLKREEFIVNVVDTSDMDTIKNQYGIPQNMQSCHTTVVGENEYVVEGHIPVEAIHKLISEKPLLSGIAMSGMPAGSPGMPGKKQGVFNIFSIDDVGDISQFMEI